MSARRASRGIVVITPRRILVVIHLAATMTIVLLIIVPEATGKTVFFAVFAPLLVFSKRVRRVPRLATTLHGTCEAPNVFSSFSQLLLEHPVPPRFKTNGCVVLVLTLPRPGLHSEGGERCVRTAVFTAKL
jgi:hypothetical protein